MPAAHHSISTVLQVQSLLLPALPQSCGWGAVERELLLPCLLHQVSEVALGIRVRVCGWDDALGGECYPDDGSFTVFEHVVSLSQLCGRAAAVWIGHKKEGVPD